MIGAADESGGDSDVEYFQELADGAPVMIWMSGHDLGCFYFNRAWLDYRGRTLEEEAGNGWAEGVHPDDLERCIQHYVSSFEKRVAFAMSYRLRHSSGEYRWILDRGAPHYAAEGTFLGFYGGCAETFADHAVERIRQLRVALIQMEEFAYRLAVSQADSPADLAAVPYTLEAKLRDLRLARRRRQHAAVEFGKLAADMRTLCISPGGCLS